jgi:hypothetical protein
MLIASCALGFLGFQGSGSQGQLNPIGVSRADDFCRVIGLHGQSYFESLGDWFNLRKTKRTRNPCLLPPASPKQISHTNGRCCRNPKRHRQKQEHTQSQHGCVCVQFHSPCTAIALTPLSHFFLTVHDRSDVIGYVFEEQTFPD